MKRKVNAWEEMTMINVMLRRLVVALKGEEGIETLEWIAMAFLIIVLLAVVVYPGTLSAGINTVITNIIANL
jgi:hypothetical protein